MIDFQFLGEAIEEETNEIEEEKNEDEEEEEEDEAVYEVEKEQKKKILKMM